MHYKNSIFLLLFTTITSYASTNINITPGIISLVAGDSSTNTIIISQQNSPSIVNLEIKGLPQGVTSTFSPKSISSNIGISTLTINTTKEVLAGNYAVEISGKGIISESIKLEVKKDMSFIHPGILLSKAQLDQMVKNVNSELPIWKQALLNTQTSPLGKKDYVPSRLNSVNADDPKQSNAIINDANAAYTQALLWYITKDSTYADNAIHIMDTWSEQFTEGFSGSNSMNLASWTGDVWPRAAEIIRYTYLNNDNSSKWNNVAIERFENMLEKQYVSIIHRGRPYGFYGGNLNASSAAALINIGVFTNNTSVFLRGISMWRATLPAYIYQVEDGPIPVPPLNWSASQSSSTNLQKLWYNQEALVNGLSQETCRDLGHVSWGISALANGAETAKKQGIVLESEYILGTQNAVRMAHGIEFNSSLINNNSQIPLWLCNGNINLGSSVGTGEILFNDLVNRRAMSLPQTANYLDKKRPTRASYFMVWETLTHYNNP